VLLALAPLLAAACSDKGKSQPPKAPADTGEGRPEMRQPEPVTPKNPERSTTAPSESLPPTGGKSDQGAGQKP
jgi:hypothetical protein